MGVRLAVENFSRLDGRLGSIESKLLQLGFDGGSKAVRYIRWGMEQQSVWRILRARHIFLLCSAGCTMFLALLWFEKPAQLQIFPITCKFSPYLSSLNWECLTKSDIFPIDSFSDFRLCSSDRHHRLQSHWLLYRSAYAQTSCSYLLWTYSWL